MNQRRFRLLLAVAVCVVSSFLLFTHGGQDDTYITYFAAHVLGETGRLVNYSGQWVEQSSSLGLVLVLGVLHAVTRLDVPVLGYAFGLFCLGASVVLAERLAARFVTPRGSAWVAAGVCSMPALSYWSTSGMEAPFVALTALSSVLALTRAIHGGVTSPRRAVVVAVVFFAFASARPETPLLGFGLVLVAAVWAWSIGEGHVVRARLGLSSALLGVVLLVLLRLAFFGEWAPNPALVKQHGFDFDGGARYLFAAAVQSNPVAVVAVVPAVGLVALWVVSLAAARLPALSDTRLAKAWGPRSMDLGASPVGATVTVLLTALAAGYLVFVVASGGDWMVGGRFLAPVTPALGLLIVAVLGQRKARVGVMFGTSLVLAHLVADVAFLRSGDPEGRPWSLSRIAMKKVAPRVSPEFWGIELANKVHARDAVTATELERIVGRAHAHLGRPVTILSGQAGLVAYHTFKHHFGHARFLDLWNITGRDLEACLGMEPFRYSIYGTAHDLGRVLDGLAQRGKDCGLGGLPDIYFNERLRPPHQKALRPHGYVVVHHQTGPVKNSREEGALPSHNVADGHIVVKKELADALGLEPVDEAWRWNLDP